MSTPAQKVAVAAISTHFTNAEEVYNSASGLVVLLCYTAKAGLVFPAPYLGFLCSRMGEADVSPNQTDEKPPESALVSGEDSVVWSHEVEVCLFHAMIGHKPVGKRPARPKPRMGGWMERKKQASSRQPSCLRFSWRRRFAVCPVCGREGGLGGTWWRPVWFVRRSPLLHPLKGLHSAANDRQPPYLNLTELKVSPDGRVLVTCTL